MLLSIPLHKIGMKKMEFISLKVFLLTQQQNCALMSGRQNCPMEYTCLMAETDTVGKSIMVRRLPEKLLQNPYVHLRMSISNISIYHQQKMVTNLFLLMFVAIMT